MSDLGTSESLLGVEVEVSKVEVSKVEMPRTGDRVLYSVEVPLAGLRDMESTGASPLLESFARVLISTMTMTHWEYWTVPLTG